MLVGDHFNGLVQRWWMRMHYICFFCVCMSRQYYQSVCRDAIVRLWPGAYAFTISAYGNIVIRCHLLLFYIKSFAAVCWVNVATIPATAFSSVWVCVQWHLQHKRILSWFVFPQRVSVKNRSHASDAQISYKLTVYDFFSLFFSLARTLVGSDYVCVCVCVWSRIRVTYIYVSCCSDKTWGPAKFHQLRNNSNIKK